MYPDTQQNQAGVPANMSASAQPLAIPQALPGSAPASNPLTTIPASQAAQPAQRVPMPSSSVEQRVAEHARHLVKQYGNDPYRLSEALGQLKAQFQTEQFQIIPKQGDGRQ